mgnify:CR=1 FL=1
MAQSISVVINTLNEEKNIARALKSVGWADEILVCDMYSGDKTVEIAKQFGAKVVFHKKVNYVEPARNFAVSKAGSFWILILDADEEIPSCLVKRLREIASKPMVSDYIEIPRKNIIFGKWIKATGWWPDNQIRFFKKNAVVWQDKIHAKPIVEGKSLTIPPEENLAIIHHNYQTVAQFLTRMNRYTDIESEQINSQGYIFDWKDLVQKPLGEFLSRFFAGHGYEDGLHGIALSLLQAFSVFVVYLKLWELSRFKKEQISLKDIEEEQINLFNQINYWIRQTKIGKNPFKKFTHFISKRVSFGKNK